MVRGWFGGVITQNKQGRGDEPTTPAPVHSPPGPLRMVSRPLPKALILHTGGTLGMDVAASYVDTGGLHPELRSGTGGEYLPVVTSGNGAGGLAPGTMLSSLLTQVPELRSLANLKLAVPFNMDSSRVGPAEWVALAKILHSARNSFDAFVVISGTDTMAYVASALSLMLLGFDKPIVLTGSQLPLSLPRSDARQNLVDALTCAVAEGAAPHPRFREVAVCFGGMLLRGNRAVKHHSSAYRAFASPSHPPLATLGVDVDWDLAALLPGGTVYQPRFDLDPRVVRVPVVPGCDPRVSYGDFAARGVKGIVLEAFGVGNLPDLDTAGWVPWIAAQRAAGVRVVLTSQCAAGPLNPGLYRSGCAAMGLGAEAAGRMTAECAVVKLMYCLTRPDVPVGQPLAGEA